MSDETKDDILEEKETSRRPVILITSRSTGLMLLWFTTSAVCTRTGSWTMPPM